MLKFAVIYCVFMKMNPVSFLAHEGVQQFVEYLHEHKIYSIIMIHLVLDMISKSLLSTGAFEVYMNGELIHSKIEAGTQIHIHNLQRIIDEYLGMPPGSGNLHQ